MQLSDTPEPSAAAAAGPRALLGAGGGPGGGAAGTAPDTDAGRASGSLSSTLHGREQVAQTSAVLTGLLRVRVDQAEALLISEARRRGVPTPVVARQALQHPETAAGWHVLRCSVCGSGGLLRVFGDYGLVRVLVCPEGHGVICRS